MGIQYLFNKLLNLGINNTKDIEKLGLSPYDIKILNLVNYYNLFFSIFIYIKLYQLGSKNEFIFLFSFTASFIYIFMIVSGNIRNTFYFINITPILSIVLFNTLIYNVFNSITSSLIIGMGLIFLYFVIYFFRSKEPILQLFIMLTVFMLLFVATISNLLIKNTSISLDTVYQYNSYNLSDLSTLNINHILLFFLSVGILFIYYTNFYTIKTYLYPNIYSINANFKNIKKKKSKEKKLLDKIKKHEKKIVELSLKEKEYLAFKELNGMDSKSNRIENTSVIIQKYLTNCNLFVIYQRNYLKTDNFHSLVLFTNQFKQKNKSINIQGTIYEDVIKRKKSIIIDDMPLKFYTHSRNIIRFPVFMYIIPIIYGDDIYEILEFCLEKKLPEVEEEFLHKMVSYLSCALENIRITHQYETMKKSLNEIESLVNKENGKDKIIGVE